MERVLDLISFEAVPRRASSTDSLYTAACSKNPKHFILFEADLNPTDRLRWK
jgi:hypothetical protein